MSKCFACLIVYLVSTISLNWKYVHTLLPTGNNNFIIVLSTPMFRIRVVSLPPLGLILILICLDLITGIDGTLYQNAVQWFHVLFSLLCEFVKHRDERCQNSSTTHLRSLWLFSKTLPGLLSIIRMNLNYPYPIIFNF